MQTPDKDKNLEVVSEGVSFEDNPEEYCKRIYEEANERVEQLQPVNRENMAFYEGRDRMLEERANDPKVKRSCLFVHEVTPGIDTRLGRVVSKLEELEYPVTFRLKDPDLGDEAKDDVAYCQRMINEQMRKCGYLSAVFEEHALGAEIFRTPSTVKVGWLTEERDVPVPVRYGLAEKARAFLAGKSIPEDHVEWRVETVGRPYAQWLPTHEFLYQPGISLFEDDSVYAIHAPWMEKRDVVAYALENDCDMVAVDEFFDEQEDGSGASEDVPTLKDSGEVDRETPLDKDERDGKFLLTENYIATYTDSGKLEMWLAVMLGNKKLIKQGPLDLKGIKFPFVPLVVHRLPGRMENLSSIDKCKEMQRLYNEAINSFLDGITYRIFPPFKVPNGTTFEEEPTYGPAQIWYLTDPEALRPVIDNPGQLPDLPQLIQSIGAKIRDTLNAQDISRGFQSQQYEKATSTSLRAAGEQTRAMPINKLFGESIVKVAQMFLDLNRQNNPEGYRFVHDMIIDVPSLTNVADPQSEKQDALLLLTTMTQDPMFQSPTGMMKRRNAWESLVRKFTRIEVEDFVLSEEELTSDIESQRNVQLAQMDKQNAMEELSIGQ